jgi:hypothetical protein
MCENSTLRYAYYGTPNYHVFYTYDIIQPMAMPIQGKVTKKKAKKICEAYSGTLGPSGTCTCNTYTLGDCSVK